MTATGDAGYMVPPPTEQSTLLTVFGQMLQGPTSDGGQKRARGEKSPWWRDKDHEAAMYRHLEGWETGERFDPDNGMHPLVAVAWRALAIAYIETHGEVNPDA